MKMLKLTDATLITDDERTAKRVVVETDCSANEISFYILNVGILQMSFRALSDIIAKEWADYMEGKNEID